MAARSRAVLLILWFALIVIPWSGGWAQEYPVSLMGPDIRVSPESLDFGSLKAGEKTRGTLAISNPGTVDLEVTLSGLERADFVITGPISFLLRPNRTRRVRISCIALEGSSGSSPLDIVQATLRIEHNVPNRHAVLVFLIYRLEPIPDSGNPPEIVSFFDGGTGKLQMPFRNGAKWRVKQRKSCDGAGCSSYDFQWTLRN